MNELDMDLLREVRIEDKTALKPILDASNKISCDYNFANLYLWGGIYAMRWGFYKGLLLLYSGKDDILLMPVGRPFVAEELLEISDAARVQGKRGDFAIVEAAFVEANPGLADFFNAGLDKDNADYVYSARALVELKGRKLHKKKNLLSQFLRNNPGYRCERMGAADAAECFSLAEKWCEDKSCEAIGFTHETSALERAFDKYGELGLDGLVITAKGALVAFSIFDRQNRDTAVVHFEKYDPEVKGSAQVINWETARVLAERYEYVNREQDLGIEGLRRAKESYCPLFTVKVYTLRRKVKSQTCHAAGKSQTCPP
jgi:hypothetical protein